MDVYDDPKYLEYLRELEEDRQRSDERRGKPRPHAWGEPLGNGHYFCGACWDSGYGDGGHPYSDPPCDPIPRRRDIG